MSRWTPERRRVIAACAPVTLLFAITDALAVGHFAAAAFAIRVLWAGLLVGVAYALGRAGERATRAWLWLLGGSTSFFFGLLVWMTGGSSTPMFHWILAMPLVVAVVVQDQPSAVVASGATTIASGLLLLGLDHRGGAALIEWLVQAAGMVALAIYAARTYEQLRRRQRELDVAAKVTEERARVAAAALEARDDFMAVAAHELWTPLASLQLRAETLERLSRRRDSESEAAIQQRLPALVRQVHRLANLVGTLLDAHALASGKLVLEPLAPVDWGDIILRVIDTARDALADARCPVDVQVPTGVAVGRWDRRRLEQVVAMLLENAIKYGRGKPLRVALVVEGATARLEIEDQGQGISAEAQQRIFARFERAVSVSHYGGLGLGLWISRRVIEQMDGRISVSSEQGKGARFVVELPLPETRLRAPSVT